MVVVSLVSCLIFPHDNPLLAPVLRVSDHPSGQGGVSTDFPRPYPQQQECFFWTVSFSNPEGTTFTLVENWRKMSGDQPREGGVGSFLTRGISQLVAHKRLVFPSTPQVFCCMFCSPSSVLPSHNPSIDPPPSLPLVKKQLGWQCIFHSLHGWARWRWTVPSTSRDPHVFWPDLHLRELVIGQGNFNKAAGHIGARPALCFLLFQDLWAGGIWHSTLALPITFFPLLIHKLP